MKRWISLFFLVAAGTLCAETTDACPSEVIVDLRNPTYKNGILYTTEGGVIKNQDIRIQARTIQYIRRNEGGKLVHWIEAEGDLMIQYKGQVYVGSELEYDFVKKTGTVYDGKTFSTIWYVGGDTIQLNSDGSYKVVNAFITTCENQDSSWDFHAGSVDVLKDSLFEAKKVRFRLFQFPAFWLPSFKINLKKFKEPIFRYYANWDKGQGPRVGFRYQLYSWEKLALYGRLEYRWKTGWGGAFETEYLPEHLRTTFVTRSYVGTNRLETAPDKKFRYRLEGALYNTSENQKTRTTLTWDKYSDVRMPADFKSDDFEVNTAKRTILYVRHQERDVVAFLKVRPRVNPFESIQQDLPTLYASMRPIEIGPTGIISSHFLKASYLDFDYSDQLVKSLPDYQSIRIEIREKLYRPFHLGPLILTPSFGGTGLFYGTSPSHQPKTLGFLSYGVQAHFHGQRTYSHYKHIVEPYLEYTALTRPTTPPDDHYIFSIQDGYNKIQQIQIGFRNLLFSQWNSPKCIVTEDEPRLKKDASFSADIYANAFFSDPVIPQVVPRGYLWLAWRLPSTQFSFHNCWNFRNHTLDFSNARFKWTINENIAISLEGRYRSRFDWRKANHENFILDVTRSETELLLSPLSDRRITFLTNFFVRLTPFWEMQFQSHHGFYRLTEPPYNEFKVEFSTWISSAWKLKFGISHTQKDAIRFSFGLNLVKK